MISICVSSKNDEFLIELENNLNKTIGVIFELIVFENKEGQALTIVYNKLLRKCKYDIVCFLHEDIKFLTQNWGTNIINILSDSKIGLVGVGGAIYKSKYPSSWASISESGYRSNIKLKESPNNKLVDENQNKKDSYSEVVVLDGCFIAGTRNVFNEYLWNEDDFNHFHLYDLDICVRVGMSHKIVVANNIILVHYSAGNFEIEWYTDTMKFHYLYKDLLPIDKLVNSYEKKEYDYQSLSSFFWFLYKLKKFKYQRFKIFCKMLTIKPISKYNLMLLKSFFN